METLTYIPSLIEHMLPAEHARLVRLCAYLVGDHDAAEDLAQETLIEAWRQQHKLVDPDGRSAWLNAVARNVCLRWARRRGRELARVEPLPDEPSTVDSFDFEIELERDELATLLDRALALLPPDTRDVLVQTYVEGSPHAEIAQRLGLSANAVGVRVHRGKLALRRILTEQFPDDARAYGFTVPEHDGWQKTRIWCPRCGQHHFLGHLDRDQGALTLRCPVCHPVINFFEVHTLANLRQVKGYQIAYRQASAWAGAYFRQALQEPPPCPLCGKRTSVQRCSPENTPPYIEAVRGDLRPLHGVHVHHCNCTCFDNTLPTYAALHGLILDLPPMRRFWRAHKRIHTLPERCITYEQRPALLLRFQNNVGTASIDAVFDQATFDLLHLDGGSDD